LKLATDAKKVRVEKYLKAHPDAKITPHKSATKVKRSANTQRKKKDEPARLKRKADGEKKLSQKPAPKKEHKARPKAQKKTK